MEISSLRRYSKEERELNLRLNIKKILGFGIKDVTDPPMNSTERRMKNISADVPRKAEAHFNLRNEAADNNHLDSSRNLKYSESKKDNPAENMIKLPSLKAHPNAKQIKELVSLSFRGISNKKERQNLRREKKELLDQDNDAINIKRKEITSFRSKYFQDLTSQIQKSLKKEHLSLTPNNRVGAESTLENFGKGKYVNVDDNFRAEKLLKEKGNVDKAHESEHRDILGFKKHHNLNFNIKKKLKKNKVNKDESLEEKMPIVSAVPYVLTTIQIDKKKQAQAPKLEKDHHNSPDNQRAEPFETQRGRKRDIFRADPLLRTNLISETGANLISTILGTTIFKSPPSKANYLSLEPLPSVDDRHLLSNKFETKKNSPNQKALLVQGEDGKVGGTSEDDAGEKQFMLIKNAKQSKVINLSPNSEVIKSPKKHFQRRKLRKELVKTEAELAQESTKKSGSLQENINSFLVKRGFSTLPQNANPAGTTVLIASSSTYYDNSSQAITPYGRLICDIDIIFSKRYHQYFEFLAQINYSNRVIVNLNSSKPVRYHVGKGNNSKLVKSLMKRRWWWVECSEPGPDTNFIWTQLKSKDFIESLSVRMKSQELESNVEFELEKKAIQKTYADALEKNQLITSFDFEKLVSLKMLRESPLDYNSENINEGKMEEELEKIEVPGENYICNHLEFNAELSNKKSLFSNLKEFYERMGVEPFKKIPLTFHVSHGLNDPEFQNFKTYYSKLQQEVTSDDNQKAFRNVWIIKPGENTNRGTGISVTNDIKEIQEIINSIEPQAFGEKTYIIQKYIENPLLYCKRKFDIRCYFLLTNAGGYLKGYWYQDGYIRTSSKEFSTKDLQNKMIHLTNDAVQKKGEEYGKFENANKISYQEFQRYLTSAFPEDKINFYDQIYPVMKSRCLDAIFSVFNKIDSNRRMNTFEVFGLDYMIDEAYNVWLIEINSNPCLELSSGLLGKIIPTMLENAFRISLDTIYPPPINWPKSKKHLIAENALDYNKFYLIFDERQYIRNKNDLEESAR